MESSNALLLAMEKISIKRNEMIMLEARLSEMSGLEAKLKFQLEDNLDYYSHMKKNVNSKFGDGKDAMAQKCAEIKEVKASFGEIRCIRESIQKQLAICKTDLLDLRNAEITLRTTYYADSCNINSQFVETDTSAEAERNPCIALGAIRQSHVITVPGSNAGTADNYLDIDDTCNNSIGMQLVRAKLEIEGMKRKLLELEESNEKTTCVIKGLENNNYELTIRLEEAQIALEELSNDAYKMSAPPVSPLYTEEDFTMLRTSCQLLVEQANEEKRSSKESTQTAHDEACKDKVRYFKAIEEKTEELLSKTREAELLKEQCDTIPQLEDEIRSLEGYVKKLRADLQEADATISSLTVQLQRAGAQEKVSNQKYTELALQSEQALSQLQLTVLDLRDKLQAQVAEVQGREAMFLTYQDAMTHQLSGLRREVLVAKTALSAAEEECRASVLREEVWMRELAGFCRNMDINVGGGGHRSDPRGRVRPEDEDQTSSDDDSNHSHGGGTVRVGGVRAGSGVGLVAKTTAELQLESLQRQHVELEERESRIRNFVVAMRSLLERKADHAIGGEVRPRL